MPSARTLYRGVISLRALTLLAMIVLAVLFLWLLIDPDQLGVLWQPRSLVLPDSLSQEVWVLLMSMVGLSLGAAEFTLWHMYRLFGRYAQGEALSAASAVHIRRIGQGLLLCAGVAVLRPPLESLALSLSDPEPGGHLVLQFGSNEIGLVLGGGLLIVIGWAMQDAARMAQDLREIV